MSAEAVHRLAGLQTEDGSFPSEVTGPAGAFVDRNGFTAAIVLRNLRSLGSDSGLERIRSRALAFIERCRSRSLPGAFGFWPEDGWPDWAERLPADIDDTAIMTTELLRYGRITQRDALRTVCTVLLRHRVIPDPGCCRPPWIADGALLTWIGAPDSPNLVDCCVNANAVALMAMIRATHLPSYEEAVRTINDGLVWAGSDPARLRSLTPFYPALNDLQEAVEHAVECGASALAPTLERLHRLITTPGPSTQGCCSSAYGATVWRCEAVALARYLRQAASLPLADRDDAGSRPNQLRRGAPCRTTDMLISTGPSTSTVGESTTRMALARLP
jgi:hypothetical protein